MLLNSSKYAEQRMKVLAPVAGLGWVAQPAFGGRPVDLVVTAVFAGPGVLTARPGVG